MKTIEQNIIERLQTVTSNSIIGKSIQRFCEDFIVLKDIPVIVKQLKDQIKDNEPVMLMVLKTAENLLFFKNLKLKTCYS